MELIPIIYCEFYLFLNKFHKKSFELLYILQCMVLIWFLDGSNPVPWQLFTSLPCLFQSPSNKGRATPKEAWGSTGSYPYGVVTGTEEQSKSLGLWYDIEDKAKNKTKIIFSLHLNSNNITTVFPKWNVNSLYYQVIPLFL